MLSAHRFSSCFNIVFSLIVLLTFGTPMRRTFFHARLERLGSNKKLIKIKLRTGVFLKKKKTFFWGFYFILLLFVSFLFLHCNKRGLSLAISRRPKVYSKYRRILYARNQIMYATRVPEC